MTLSTNQVAVTAVTTSTPSSSTNTTATPSSSNPSPSYSNASTNTVASPTSCLSPTYANASTNTPITSPIRKSVVCFLMCFPSIKDWLVCRYTPPSAAPSISHASPTPPRRHGVFNHSQFHHRNTSDPRYQEHLPRYYQFADQPIYGRVIISFWLNCLRILIFSLLCFLFKCYWSWVLRKRSWTSFLTAWPAIRKSFGLNCLHN